MREWEAWVSGAFLGGYLEAAAGAAFLPEPAALDDLIDVFVLNKAFYELAYELNNRPDWVGLPLDGIRAIAARGEARS
jgi:predicted trehalose synthase